MYSNRWYAANKEPKLKITDTKLCVPVVTLSTQDNVKLLRQLESGFKRTVNWTKYLSKISNEDFLIDPSFQGVNRPFTLSFKNADGRESYRQYYFPTVKNFMIDRRSFFDQPIKKDLKTYDNIRKIETGQGHDYTTACLLDYTYFEKYYKLIAIDLSKQQKLDADPKAIQQISFTQN